MTPNQLKQLQVLLELAVLHEASSTNKYIYATALDLSLKPEFEYHGI